MNYLFSRYTKRYSVKTIFFTLFFVMILQTSCNKDNREYVNQEYNPELVPTISDDSVTMNISDSGQLKYKVVTKTMQVFDKAKDPHWYFPHKIYMEEYDANFRVIVTIVADTVWNYTKRNTWRLKGHVVIHKKEDGSIFKTEELFWDQKKQKIYTEKFIDIHTPERDLKGYGLDASQDLASYRIRRPTGVMRLKKEDM